MLFPELTMQIIIYLIWLFFIFVFYADGCHYGRYIELFSFLGHYLKWTATLFSTSFIRDKHLVYAVLSAVSTVLLGVSVTLLPTDVEEDTVTVSSPVNIPCWMVSSTDWVICHLSDNKLYLEVGLPTLPSIWFVASSSGFFSYILVCSFMSAYLTLFGVGQPKRHFTWPIPSCTVSFIGISLG